MSSQRATVETAPEEIVEPAPARSATKPDERTKRKRQPPYAVILHNDDLNGVGFVIGVLRKVFNYDLQTAKRLTAEAHYSGRSLVWSGVLEVAELKADQIRSCGPDPEAKAKGALGLRVSLEPLPQ